MKLGFWKNLKELFQDTAAVSPEDKEKASFRQQLLLMKRWNQQVVSGWK